MCPVASTNDIGMLSLYYYDALGRRIGRRSGDGTVYTRYYYDGLNILMTREKSPATGAAWRTRKAYTLKQASIAQIIAEHTATAWNAQGAPSVWNHQYYHFDLLGNTSAMTDSNGWVSNIIDMEAFGTVLEGGQSGFRLTTKEYDPEAGAYYFNARWYDAGLCGRFLQKTTYPRAKETEYGFCENKPTQLVDPNGNFFGCFIGALAVPATVAGMVIGVQKCEEARVRFLCGCGEQPPLICYSFIGGYMETHPGSHSDVVTKSDCCFYCKPAGNGSTEGGTPCPYCGKNHKNW